MKAHVDFLPESYRARHTQQQRRRELFWVTIAMVTCTVMADITLRLRSRAAREIERLAIEENDVMKRRVIELEVIDENMARLRRDLSSRAQILDRRRMAEILDELIADLSPGVRFHQLRCELGAEPGDQPQIQIDASSPNLADLATYLDTLAFRGTLPRLYFERTELHGEDGLQRFRLDTDSGRQR